MVVPWNLADPTATAGKKHPLELWWVMTPIVLENAITPGKLVLAESGRPHISFRGSPEQTTEPATWFQQIAKEEMRFIQ